jgi:hypothetical protein
MIDFEENFKLALSMNILDHIAPRIHEGHILPNLARTLEYRTGKHANILQVHVHLTREQGQKGLLKPWSCYNVLRSLHEILDVVHGPEGYYLVSHCMRALVVP